MKGDTSWPLIMVIVSLVLILGILFTSKYLSIPTTRTIIYEQKYDSADMVLISLLSSTHNEKSLQELIGQHIITGNPSDLSFVKDRLDLLIPNKCYRLSTPHETLAESIGSQNCQLKDVRKDANISLPYNRGKLVENLVLVIG